MNNVVKYEIFYDFELHVTNNATPTVYDLVCVEEKGAPIKMRIDCLVSLEKGGVARDIGTLCSSYPKWFDDINEYRNRLLWDEGNLTKVLKGELPEWKLVLVTIRKRQVVMRFYNQKVDDGEYPLEAMLDEEEYEELREARESLKGDPEGERELEQMEDDLYTSLARQVVWLSMPKRFEGNNYLNLYLSIKNPDGSVAKTSAVFNKGITGFVEEGPYRRREFTLPGQEFDWGNVAGEIVRVEESYL